MNDRILDKLSSIELSHTLTDEMPVYPGDAFPRLRKMNSYEKDGFNNFRLSAGMHTGTHIDGPMHLTTSDLFINEIPLEQFTGRGCFLNASPTSHAVGKKVIPLTTEYESLVQPECIVVLYTGMSRFFGRKEYFQDYPTVSMDLARFLVERRVKMVCLDSPSPDRHPYEIHKLLLEHHVLIAENLTRLDQLISLHAFEIIALPLNIRTDSSPARIIARYPMDQQ